MTEFQQERQQERGFRLNIFGPIQDAVAVMLGPRVREKSPEVRQRQQMMSLTVIQTRVQSLNSLCQRFETRIPKLASIVEVCGATIDLVVEIRSSGAGITPGKDNRSDVIKLLKALARACRLIKALAACASKFSPNPWILKVQVVAGVAEALLNTICNCYDVINADKQLLDAVIELIADIGDIIPLDGNRDKIRNLIVRSARTARSAKQLALNKDTDGAQAVVIKFAELEDLFNNFMDMKDAAVEVNNANNGCIIC